MFLFYVIEKVEVVSSTAPVNHVSKPPASSSKEFDPLSMKSVDESQNSVLSSFGLPSDGNSNFVCVEYEGYSHVAVNLYWFDSLMHFHRAPCGM